MLAMGFRRAELETAVSCGLGAPSHLAGVRITQFSTCCLHSESSMLDRNALLHMGSEMGKYTDSFLGPFVSGQSSALLCLLVRIPDYSLISLI